MAAMTGSNKKRSGALLDTARPGLVLVGRLVRKKIQRLGTVVAANEKDAIKQFQIESAGQFKITVTKISSKRVQP